MFMVYQLTRPVDARYACPFVPVTPSNVHNLINKVLMRKPCLMMLCVSGEQDRLPSTQVQFSQVGVCWYASILMRPTSTETAVPRSTSP
jgi:hypothetical protein